MKLIEAKEIILQLIRSQIDSSKIETVINLTSPDGDVGKFFLNGKPTRVIAPFSGFHVNINLDWFSGSTAPPIISGGPFQLAIFSVCAKGQNKITDYYICDVQQLRQWVLDFNPNGHHHRDHKDWRGNIHVIKPNVGYFRWGDEPLHELNRHNRIVDLNNIREFITEPPLASESYYQALNEEVEKSTKLTSKERLSRLAKAKKLPDKVVVLSTNYKRNADVIAEVLQRAQGVCENCNETAPFLRKSNNTPYLEIHHVVQLSHGGEDTVHNAVALCPNCHREMHFG